MGSNDRALRKRVAVPFLGESSRYAKTVKGETEKEVHAYYEAIKSAQPYLDNGVPLEKLKIKLPSRPNILDWLDRVERWGFPNPGTFLDQPVLFFAQIEGAIAGRKQAIETKQKANDVFANAPSIMKR